MTASRFDQIVTWENLLLAFRKAAKGKRGYLPASTFEHQVADKLINLQQNLIDKTYRSGGYRHFYIHEPKRRKISAAPFRDRVVHHALCNVIEPLFERHFIPHSYANRKGKGTHLAVDTMQAFARRHRYVLRMDIVKHFPSLDHALLKNDLFRIINDDDIRWLINQIISSGEAVLQDEYQMVFFSGDDLFAVNRARGLPIGNLTSQFWSNCYMNLLDWFVVGELRCNAYLRYVDDFAIFSDSKSQLWAWKRAIVDKLASMRLTIHENVAQVAQTRFGIPWLGFVVYPDYRKLKKRNAVNFTRRLEHNLDRYQQGKLTFAELDASVQGWLNHVRYADTWGLRRYVFNNHPLEPPKK